MKWPDDFIDKVIWDDCMNVLPQIPEGAIDAVITDPPYGIDLETDFTVKNRDGNRYDKIVGDGTPFDPSLLVKRFMEKPMILWGADSYFDKLPKGAYWLAWDKVLQNGLKVRIGECEFAWTNFSKKSRIFRYLWSGGYREKENKTFVHPTQKPIDLMRWCIQLATKEGDLVLDPYAGSGSTLVAAKQLGRRYIGIEIDPKYCRIAEDRLRQVELFNQERAAI